MASIVHKADGRIVVKSKMFEGGADLKSVSQMLGHASVEMVLKHY